MRILTNRLLPFCGALGITSCAADLASRDYYPRHPSARDVLAHDPCSVSREPQIIVRAPNADPELKQRAVEAANKSVDQLRSIDSTLVCGLKAIEFLGDPQYRASAEDESTKNSTAHYATDELILRINITKFWPITHEYGHHIHNTGMLAPTIERFFAPTWEWGYGSNEPTPKCPTGIEETCFVDYKAAYDHYEDWARTLEQLILNPVALHARTGLNLYTTGTTPLQDKISTIYQDVPLEKPMTGTITFGETFQFPRSDAQMMAGAVLYLHNFAEGNMIGYKLGGEGFTLLPGQSPAVLLSKQSITRKFARPDQWVYDGLRIGKDLFMHAHSRVFYTKKLGADHSAVASIRTDGKSSLREYNTDDDDIMGLLIELEGKPAYFKGFSDIVELKILDPETNQTEVRQTWQLPKDWRPFNAYQLDSGDIIIIAVVGGGSGYESSLIHVAHIVRKPNGEFSEEAQLGAGTMMDSTLFDHMRMPVSSENLVIFPTFTASPGGNMGFFIYDLNIRKFRPVSLATQNLPKALQGIEKNIVTMNIVPNGGGGKLLSITTEEHTLVVPFALQLFQPEGP